MLNTVVNMLFPPVCPLCEEAIADEALCPCCLKAFSEQRVAAPVCGECGAPFLDSPGPAHRCGECHTGNRPFTEARSAYLYRGRVENAIKALKYGGRSVLSAALGELCLNAAASLSILPEMIMPVPLHKKRLNSRGFNQSLLLGRVMPKSSVSGSTIRALREYAIRPSRPGLSRAREKKMSRAPLPFAPGLS